METKTLESDDATLAANGYGDVTFDNLDIYTPAGNYWVYYVVEHSVDGYKAMVMLDGTVDVNDERFKEGITDINDAMNSGVLATESGILTEIGATSAGVTTYSQPTSSPVTSYASTTLLSTVASAAENVIAFFTGDDEALAASESEGIAATYRNAYDPENVVQISGTKKWYDQSNITGTRPSLGDIALNIRRYSNNSTSTGQVEDTVIKYYQHGVAGYSDFTYTDVDGNASVSSTDSAKTYTYDEYTSNNPTVEVGDSVSWKYEGTDTSGHTWSYTITWTLQRSDDSNNSGINQWQYTITNLEKSAPDGTRWTYSIWETLNATSDNASLYTDLGYRLDGGNNGGTVNWSDSNENLGTVPKTINNFLSTKVRGAKTWSDSNNTWSQRPSVTLQLQMRYTYTDASSTTITSDWAEAKTAFQTMGISSTALSALKSALGTTEVTSSGNIDTTWNDMPIAANVSGTTYSIEYRVVETRIAYTEDGQTVYVYPLANDGDGETTEITYTYWKTRTATTDEAGITTYTYSDQLTSSPTSTYTISGTAWKRDSVNNADTRYNFVITNTMNTTELTVDKGWVDEDNAWITRPGSTLDDPNNWSVTFLLQRTTDDPTSSTATWTWMAKNGAVVTDALSDAGVIDSRLLTATISNATQTLNTLPGTNAYGEEYHYRLVEVVTGSYDEKSSGNITLDKNATETIKLVTTATSAKAQSFTNQLNVVQFVGVKFWADYGISGLMPTLTDNDSDTYGIQTDQVTLKLERRISGGTWETVYKVDANGTAYEPQPDYWTTPTTGMWMFWYTGLPEADSNGNTYEYRATEVTGSVDGFYGATASSASTTDGDLQNGDITNYPTRFTFDKLSSYASSTLSDVELTISGTGANAGKTYAIWSRTAGSYGTLASTARVWLDGTTTPESEETSYATQTASGGDAAYITGLAAGTYTVSETKTPANHDPIDSFTLTIAEDGTIAVSSTNSAATAAVTSTGTSGVEHIYTVSVRDDVFAGYLTLSKTVSGQSGTDQALEGATFNLYQLRDGATQADPTQDTLIATGITTNADGIWNSADATSLTFADDVTQTYTAYGKTYVSQGLLPGTYYFAETNSTDSAQTPSGTAQYSDLVTISQSTDHGTAAAQTVNMTNIEFEAAVTLAKVDADNGNAGINDAEFTLSYTPTAGSAQSFTQLKSGTTYQMSLDGTELAATSTATTDGSLTFTNLKKDTYTLTETANQGYSVADGGTQVITFTIGDEDYSTEKVYNLANETDQSALDARDVSPLLTASGLSNSRLYGTAFMTKYASSVTAGNEQNGATFKLQVKNGDTWSDVVTELTSGKTYAIAYGENGVASATEDTTDESTGVLKVTGLEWGTYQFVETSPVDGYYATTSTLEFTVDRTDAGTTINAGNLANMPVSLTVYKTDSTGSSPLSSGQYTVVPDTQTNSSFVDGAASHVITTGASGTGTLEGKLKVGNTYILTETTPPTGYQQMVDSSDQPVQVVLVVNEDSTITIDEARSTTPASQDDVYTGTYAIANSNSVARLTITDGTPSISIRKISSAEGHEALLGSTFEVYGTFLSAESDATVTETRTYTPEGDNALVEIEGLIAGYNYELTETVTPDGYETIQDTLYFTVNSAGTKISITEGTQAPENVSISDDEVVITVSNTPIQVTLTKSSVAGDDSTTTLLEGATFKVTGDFSTTTLDASAIKTDSTGATYQEVTTGEDGTLTINGLIADKSYTIEETAAPAGYELLTGSMQFSVNEDGTIYQTDTDVAASNISNGTLAIASGEAGAASDQLTATDTPIEITFTKTGAGTDSTAAADGIADATFTLSPTSGSTFADGTSAAKQISTDSDGTVTLTGLVANNTYTLHETYAPDGYELMTGYLTFTVNSDGTVTQTGTSIENGTMVVGSGAANEAATTITATDTPLEIELTKVNSAGALLSGSTFHVSGEFTDANAQNKTIYPTNEGGAVITGLVAGEQYIVTESSAPAGYQQLAGAFFFTVGNDGTITNLATGNVSNGSVALADNSSTTIEVTDEPVVLNLVKYAASEETDGEATEDDTTEDGTTEETTSTTLSGAVFQVVPANTTTTFADGTTTAKHLAATDENGETILTNQLIVGGTYTLSEVNAPAGYTLLEETLTFTVATDGTFQVSSTTSPEAYKISTSGTVSVFTGSVTNDPTNLTLTKVSSANTALYLGSAEFSLSPAEGATFADGSTTAKTLTTGTEGEALGIATLAKAQLIADGNTVYTLTETKAPAGYEVNSYAFTFTVATDGTITPTDASAASAAGYTVDAEGGITVTAKDTPTAFEIVKRSTSGDLLYTALFTIEGTFADTEDTTRVVGYGNTLTGALIAGETYTITETTAPNGYELLTDKLQVQVQNDGTLEVVGTQPNSFEITEDGGLVIITASDTPTELQLKKTDAAGASSEAMAGTEFTVVPATASDRFRTASLESITLTVGHDGLTGVLSGQLVVNNSYLITETKAPAGYELDSTPLKITVGSDGTIATASGTTLPSNFQIENSSGLATITASDEAIEVFLTKDDAATGTALEGAEFDLTGAFAIGNGEAVTSTKHIIVGEDGMLSIANVMTDADGNRSVGTYTQATSLTGLVGGETYELVETKAPAGYELNTETLTFTVGEDGTINFAEGYKVPSGYALITNREANTVTINASDSPIGSDPEEPDGGLDDGDDPNNDDPENTSSDETKEETVIETVVNTVRFYLPKTGDSALAALVFAALIGGTAVGLNAKARRKVKDKQND